MARKRNPELKRKKILDAALSIMREGHFLTKFSLDTVAAAAGVSKGGLIHHFPTKEALLFAVSEMVYVDFDERVRAGVDREPEGVPGRWLRSYIKTVLSEEGESMSDMSPVLLSYANQVDGLGSRFDYWREIMDQDGIDTVTATKIRMTVDGVLYTELIDGRPIARELRQEICARLLEEIEQAVEKA